MANELYRKNKHKNDFTIATGIRNKENMWQDIKSVSKAMSLPIIFMQMCVNEKREYVDVL